MWTRVRQLIIRSKATNTVCNNAAITAGSLNDYNATISDNVNYSAPCVKSIVNNENTANHVTEWRMFELLDTLPSTAMGLNNIVLQIGAPFFSAPISDMMNLSLPSSTVPKQWKAVSILPIPKIPSPLSPSDYRPISTTPVLSRLLERIVYSHRLYLPILSVSASKPQFLAPVCLSTYCIHHSNSYSSPPHHHQPPSNQPLCYRVGLFKFFDSVRHSAVLDKYLQLEMPDNIYNWIESFFRDHSNCTSFWNECSEFRKIMASIIQGSGISPASYVVTASDLHAATPGNSM